LPSLVVNVKTFLARGLQHRRAIVAARDPSIFGLPWDPNPPRSDSPPWRPAIPHPIAGFGKWRQFFAPNSPGSWLDRFSAAQKTNCLPFNYCRKFFGRERWGWKLTHSDGHNFRDSGLRHGDTIEDFGGLHG